MFAIKFFTSYFTVKQPGENINLIYFKVFNYKKLVGHYYVEKSVNSEDMYICLPRGIAGERLSKPN